MNHRHFEMAFDEAARELAFNGKLEEGGATIASSVPGVPAINVVYLDEDDTVVLFSEIGHVPDEDPSLYREFMEATFMQRDTRGAAFAVNPDNGIVVLQRELAADRLDGRSLAAVFVDFAEVGFRARRRLYRKAESEDPSPPLPGVPSEDPAPSDLGGLRV